MSKSGNDQYMYKEKTARKSDVFKTEDIEKEKKEKEKSRYKVGMDELQRMNDAMNADKERHKSQGGPMNSIKRSVGSLSERMERRITTGNYDSEADAIKQSYREILDNCDKFLSSKHDLWGDNEAGNEVVENFRDMIKKDMEAFDKISEKIKPSVNSDMNWVEILGEIRTIELEGGSIENAHYEDDMQVIDHEGSEYYYTGEGHDHYDEVSRGVGVRRFYELMGEEDLCTDNKRCMSRVGRLTERGVIREKLNNTKGKEEEENYRSFEEVLKENNGNLNYTPQVVNKLTLIKLFDVILGCRVRGTDTMSVKTDIDSSGTVRVKDVRIVKNPRVFTKNDFEKMKVRGFPALDETTCKNILTLTEENMRYLFADILSQPERDALMLRLTGLQEYIRREKALDESRNADNKVIRKGGSAAYSPDTSDDGSRQGEDEDN